MQDEESEGATDFNVIAAICKDSFVTENGNMNAKESSQKSSRGNGAWQKKSNRSNVNVSKAS